VIGSGDEVAPGDRLRFRPLPLWPQARYIQVGSVDGTGGYSPFYPAGDGVSVALPVRGEPLDGSIRLDDAPGPERLFVVLSATPLSTRDVRQVAEAHAVDGERVARIGGAEVATAWIVLPKARRFVGGAVEMLPVVLILAAQLGSASTGQRVAIVASADAAEGQAPLRYADRDADRMEAALRDLGGFDRIERLRDPRPQALRAALDGVERAAARDPGLQMVFYYSGHADERGLLIGAERFSFDELRARLEGSRAAVRVALIDACYAGTMVQTKGGAPAPGYALDLVAPTRVRGAAIIAAGTATELAQESGEIEGSYFTHHLLSALRGAGDRDGDGVVTLAETYQYAYSHTLAATLPSIFGPQHPSYEYRLAGTGELPLTRLGRGRADDGAALDL
jgi:hypothetical protein